MGETFLATDSFHHADVTHSFAPSPFLSETKHHHQQQGVCIFSCIFANASRRMAATAILPSAGVGASAPTSTLVSMPATTAAGIYKALQATSTTTSGGVLINRVLAHHIQHSTFATCVHYLRQAAEADQVGQGRVHCICCRKTNSCRFGHGCRFDG